MEQTTITGEVFGTIPLDKYKWYEPIKNAMLTAIDRRDYANILSNQVDVNQLRIIVKRDGDFTTVALFYQDPDTNEITVGLGSSKRSRKDKEFAMRGVIYAALDALADLDLELF